ASGDLVATDLRLGIVARIPRGGGSPKTIARVKAPRGLAILPSGALIVLSMGPDQLVKVTHEGVVASIVAGKPFRFPIAVLLAPAGPGYLVSDGYAGTVWAVSESGEVRPRIERGKLVRPEGLARDDRGGLLIADPAARQIFRPGPGG